MTATQICVTSVVALTSVALGWCIGWAMRSRKAKREEWTYEPVFGDWSPESIAKRKALYDAWFKPDMRSD